MRWVSSGSQMREADRKVTEDIGVPGVCLMETAARAVAFSIRKHHPARARCGVVVVCGSGNNGGDGYAIARWLDGFGYPVSIWSLSPKSDGDAGIMRKAALNCGLSTVSGLEGAALIVDAIFGTGLSRDVEGAYADVLAAINDHPAPVVSVDIPSGLNADTGEVMGVAVKATRTVTFGHYKPGILGEPGVDLSGIVEVADIGLNAVRAEAAAEIPDAEDLAHLWPVRKSGDHKNRSGHLLVLAGSRSMAGAAILACEGALAAGVGLITLAVPRGAIPRMSALPPEVMVIESGTGDRLEPLPESALAGRTALLAGPGLGGGFGDLGRPVREWLKGLWETCSLPIVFDADALTCMGQMAGGPRLITPHPGEAGRILGCSASDIQRERFNAVQRLSSKGCVAVLKGRHTLVSAPGHLVSVNMTGGQALATGGSGDVLAGMLGALLARGVDARDAARVGAHVHGRSGDRLWSRRAGGWRASDISQDVPEAVQELMDFG